MTEDSTPPGGAAADFPEPVDKPARIQSTIQFPYSDLASAIEVVVALHGSGAAALSPDQLAPRMKHTQNSGTFRLKVAAARMFGLVTTAPGRIELTDLGFRLTDPTQEKAARIEAFLSVELYAKVFEEWKGRILPPRPAAFERMLEGYGVSPKQKDKARQALDRSADYAGFYEHGRERLIMPAIANNSGRVNDQQGWSGGAEQDRGQEGSHDNGGRGGNGGNKPPGDLDPLITGLLTRLPKSADNPWPLTERVRWLKALAVNLSIVYGDGDDEIEIRALPRPSEPLRSTPGTEH